MTNYPLLQTVNSPADLRRLERRQLEQLAEELRAFLLESVSKTGGHLSSNLGTVELTIALHYVFNTPYDRIVWDVGHQTYGHKVLTGRREAMSRLRMLGGISGFPRRAESEYDTFGTAHSSTSISAALGMAVAARDRGDDRKVVAVIGDGAMSAGEAFEGFNNAGFVDTNLLVILNDNKMSISPPVGALNKYLARLLSGRTFNAARRAGEMVLAKVPPMLEFAKRAEEHVKGMVAPGTLFEEFGFNYFGPIDGHDLDALIPTLKNIGQWQGPQFLHVITRKGQGYKLAEADPVLYHGVAKFAPEAGIQSGQKRRQAELYPGLRRLAVRHGSAGFTAGGNYPCHARRLRAWYAFADEFPGRYYDVGIAEQHAVSFAAGLACEGFKPVVAIYSTFLQRAYDQLIHDVCIQNLPVVFALDRGGLVGADGATHHGAFDLSYLACIPNMTIMAPADENECRQMLYTAFHMDSPVAVRYPRGSGSVVVPVKQMYALPIGKAEIRRRGKTVALLVFGTLLATALEVGEKLDATVVNMRFVKPLDHALIRELADTHEWLVSIEENAVIGGAGGEVARSLEDCGARARLLRLGLPDRFVDHGDQSQLLAEIGLDEAGILARVKAAIVE